MSESEPFMSRQPVKSLFVIASILYGLLVRLPLLGLYFSRASNRQSSTWSFKQALSVSFVRYYFSVASRVRFAKVIAVDRSGKDPNLIVVPALPKNHLTGVLLDATVKPEERPAAWYPAAFDANNDVKRGTKVILFMFGGAYVVGGVDPKPYAATLDKLCPSLDAKLLMVGYRLAGSSGGQPFPSQLQDMVSAYCYLLDIGVSSKNIIVAGESAGGNAVLSFLRHLEESGRDLSLPGAALLSSPWVDLRFDPLLVTQHAKYSADIADIALLQWGRKAFTPKNRTTSDPYISPITKAFRSRVPIWIAIGTEEVMFDEIARFTKDMQDAGTDAQLFVAQGVTHGPVWGAGLASFDISACVDGFAAFLKERNLLT